MPEVFDEDRCTFGAWKYARRISLIPLGNRRYGLAGPSLDPIAYGTLQELADEIHALGEHLLAHPHAAAPSKAKAKLTLEYLTEIDL